MPRQTLIVAVAAALLAATSLRAEPREEMLYYRDGARVDPVEVSRILARPGLQRSIRLLPPAGAEAADATPAASPVTPASTAHAASTTPLSVASVDPAPRTHGPQSVALPVQFAFDSADILPKAREQLDAMAEGIKLLPGSHSVIIEGHTDALGPQDYNLGLSRRRADAVKRYLVQQHGIEPQRLRTVGFGKERLIDGVDATNAENRRVQFRGA